MGDKSGRHCLYNIISLLWHVTVLVQKLGDNVVDFVFKAFVSIITFLGYVGNKPCWQSVVDKTLSSHSHTSNSFSKRNTSYWTVRVLTLVDFGCRWLSQLWRVTEPAAAYREPLWSWHRGIPWAVKLGLDNHSTVRNSLYGRVTSWNESRVVSR